jgi:hypothetical protein
VRKKKEKAAKKRAELEDPAYESSSGVFTKIDAVLRSYTQAQVNKFPKRKEYLERKQELEAKMRAANMAAAMIERDQERVLERDLDLEAMEEKERALEEKREREMMKKLGLTVDNDGARIGEVPAPAFSLNSHAQVHRGADSSKVLEDGTLGEGKNMNKTAGKPKGTPAMRPRRGPPKGHE